VGKPAWKRLQHDSRPISTRLVHSFLQEKKIGASWRERQAYGSRFRGKDEPRADIEETG
jgi:hypothetical protein